MIIRLNPLRLFAVPGLAATIAAMLVWTSTAHAQMNYTILHTFAGYPTDGGFPRAFNASLLQGPDGTLYGTTTGGGSGVGCVPYGGCGTIYQMAPDGSDYALLHNFTGAPTDGRDPHGVIQGSDGTLYGTTAEGGSADAGTIYQMAPDGSGYTLLHNFTGSPMDGAGPTAGLIQGLDGMFYGTTVGGGNSGGDCGDSGCGTIFRMAPDGSGYTLLHRFTGSDGSSPYSSLIQGSDGTLYGTTGFGGSAFRGTIYQIAADGSGYAVLHNFTGAPTDGFNPQAGLIQGLDGMLYGTTYSGGGSGCLMGAGCGTIFRIAPDGSGYTLLHSFTDYPTDGSLPYAALLQGSDGTLYGMTVSGGIVCFCGTISQLAPDGSGYTLLHSFPMSQTDGVGPKDGLIQGLDGAFYGTTEAVSPFGSGVVFRLSL